MINRLLMSHGELIMLDITYSNNWYRWDLGNDIDSMWNLLFDAKLIYKNNPISG